MPAPRPDAVAFDLEPLLRGAGLTGVVPGQLALVAAHPWDVQGAKAAGLMAGFVARGRIFPAIMAVPDVQGGTLAEVAGKFAGVA